MNRIILILAIALLAQIAHSQYPCLPEGIKFTTQEQIDSFPVNYPGCTEIEGDVIIGELFVSTDIYNLDGLNMVKSINGMLRIADVDLLSNLYGLGELEYIGGDLQIHYNDLLINLEGLEKLSTIGESFWIYNNDAMISLSGVENITSISVALSIDENDVLPNLSGLESIGSVGDLSIHNNDALKSLIGLDGVTSVESLNIEFNVSLTNLNGLEGLTFISDGLVIWENNALTSVSGLNGLVNVGWVRISRNAALINLTGLEALTTISSGLWVDGNPSMTSLSGLEGLTYVGGNLKIGATFPGYNNTNLQSIDALASIGPGSIKDLRITGNPILSNCDITSICYYLVAPNGIVTINSNAPGCNSIVEVEEACDEQGIEDHNLPSLTIYPNPTDNGSVTLSLENSHELYLSCFNTFGQQVHMQKIQAIETEINVSTWPQGIYLAVVNENGKVPVAMSKFIVR